MSEPLEDEPYDPLAQDKARKALRLSTIQALRAMADALEKAEQSNGGNGYPDVMSAELPTIPLFAGGNCMAAIEVTISYPWPG
jgi:hypothetical protein